jgi:hypothetical protein
MWICVSVCEYLVIWCDKTTVHELNDSTTYTSCKLGIYYNYFEWFKNKNIFSNTIKKYSNIIICSLCMCYALLMLTAYWAISWKPSWWNKVHTETASEKSTSASRYYEEWTCQEARDKSSFAEKLSNITKPERSQSWPDLRGSPGATKTWNIIRRYYSNICFLKFMKC